MVDVSESEKNNKKEKEYRWFEVPEGFRYKENAGVHHKRVEFIDQPDEEIQNIELKTADERRDISIAITAIKLMQDIAKRKDDVVLPFESGFFAGKCDKTILEALELRKEKIPQRSESGTFYICPNCNKFIEKNEQSYGKKNIPYCKWCGQALDWKGDNQNGRNKTAHI